jgi:hypothetical protein
LGQEFRLARMGEGSTIARPMGIAKSLSSRRAGVSSPGGVYGGLSDETQKAIRKSAAGVSYTSSEIRNPLLNIINFYLPTNYKILNQWIRYYDRFHPLVGNCIDMHAEFPISQFDLELESGVQDPKILQIYEDAAIDMDLFKVFLEMSREYELIGEVYPFAHWADEKNYFDEVVVLNPDFVATNGAPLAIGGEMQFELEPDEELKRLVHSTEQKDIELKQYLDPIVLRSIEIGVNIPIDAFNISQLARKASPYDPRGTSIVLRCLKDLLYEDKLREAQYCIADAHITPKQIWKLGDPQNGYMPTDEDLADFQKLLESGAHDPLFAIVTHYGLTLDLVGATGRILPIIPEFEFVADRILTALYTSKAALHGEGPTWSSGPNIAFEILQGRYMSKREKMENWLMNKIWIPIALANGCHRASQAELAHKMRIAGKDRELVLPKIHWKQKLELVEDQQRKQFIDQARQRLDVSFKSWCGVMDINEKEEIEQIQKERSTYADPGYRKLVEQKRDLEWQKKLKEEGLIEQNQPQVVPGSGQLTFPGFGGSGSSSGRGGTAPKAPAGGGKQTGVKVPTAEVQKMSDRKHTFGGQEDRIRKIKRAEGIMIDTYERTKSEREAALSQLTKFEKEIDSVLVNAR